jgi:hypothetical protein
MTKNNQRISTVSIVDPETIFKVDSLRARLAVSSATYLAGNGWQLRPS